jgi:pyruvate dehydrogenase E1 component alpha subunit
MSVAAARPAPGNLDVERVLAHHRRMWRIRAFELAAEQAMGEGLVYGAIHLSVGQEAVASGVIVNLAAEDYIATTHRGHGHCIARGADIERMYAELFGRAGGYCRGKGGSMHIADFKIGMLGANGVVADGLPIAVGAAQAIRLKREPGIVVVFFGDGAINRGPFMESLNWAKVYGLPVLFVCEIGRASCRERVS